MSEGLRSGYEGRGSENPENYAAASAEIAAVFRQKLAGLRRRLPAWEIPTAMRALQDEKRVALRALRDRRAVARFSRKLARQRMKPPPVPEV